MCPVLLVWLFSMAFLPESQQLKSPGIFLGSLVQKPLSSAAGSLNSLSSKGSISTHSNNNQPSNIHDPDIVRNITERDVLNNIFGVGNVQLAYRNAKTMSRDHCMQNCRMDDSCVVAMHCRDSLAEEKCANLLTCTITKREKGRLCHTYVQADQPSYLPHKYSASSCQYLGIHPNCRNQPQISNTNVDEHPVLADGVVRYRYACVAGYQNSNNGSIFGVCDKQGGWIFPSLACRQSQSRGVPSSLISLVQKATAVEGKRDAQGPSEIQLAPPNVDGLFGDSADSVRHPMDISAPAPAPDPAISSPLEQAAQHIKSQIFNDV